MELIFVYMTTGSRDEAERIGRALVEERLAACVNIVPGMRSIYRWQGAVETADETIVVAKTRADLFDRLTARVKELHSYEVPCVVELPIGRGNPDYLGWLEAESG